MKKKIILTLSLFLIFVSLTFPQHTIASCGKRPLVGCWESNHNTDCTVGAAQYCCGSTNECTDLQSQPVLPASCVTRPLVGCWEPPNNTSCIAGASQYCCASVGDCTNLQSGSSTLPGGNQNPTCGTTGAGSTGTDSINTAIGCIPFQNTDVFVGTILKWAVGIGGGIAFLIILLGSFSVMTSAGNPERLKDGQQIITAAVSGLILLIFSIFILKFIGIDILGLGAFGFESQSTSSGGGGGSFKK